MKFLKISQGNRTKKVENNWCGLYGGSENEMPNNLNAYLKKKLSN